MTRSRFPQFAWGLLTYNLVVIIWGAYVRASFSGDGCGAHWPNCGGQMIPTNGQIKTIVEYLHRLTAGLSLMSVGILAFWAWWEYPKGHRVRLGAGAAVAFTLSEALIGAALVLFKWVAHNPSAYRAVAMSSHLTNTFILLAALTLTAWWASGGAGVQWGGGQSPAIRFALGVGMIATLALGITGSLAALGDMLYPSTSVLVGIHEDFAPTANYLLRLRPMHPVVAISVGIYLVWMSNAIARLRPTTGVRRYARVMTGIFTTQLGVGFVNLMLHAPIWMQLQHLLIADLLWIDLVLLAAAALSEERSPAPLPVPQKGYAKA